MQASRALVTGGAGFIGSHIVDALLARGDEVRVLDDLSSGRLANLARSRHAIEFIEGDIRDPRACRRACDGVDVVFHHAAFVSVPRSVERPELAMDINVTGTAQILSAARNAGVARVVYASSSAVYGDNRIMPIRETDAGEPLSPYGLSKRMNEELAEIFSRCYGLELVGLRYFNVYGPRQDPNGPYAAAVPKFFAAYAEGGAPRIFGDGTQSRDFIFVGDVVRANLLAASVPIDGPIVLNVGSGTAVTISELAKSIGCLMGATAAPIHVDRRPGDISHMHAVVDNARSRLGFAASTALPDGLRLTMAAVPRDARFGGAFVMRP